MVSHANAHNDLGLRLRKSRDFLLARLSPLWAKKVSLIVPHPATECRRRLEQFAGRPGLFEERGAAGTVSEEGFRLVWRGSARFGMYYAVAVARGRLAACEEGTRVEVRTTYAPWPIVWTLLAYVALIGVPVFVAPARPLWGFASPAIVIVSWVWACWENHSWAEHLQWLILTSLMEEHPPRWDAVLGVRVWDDEDEA